MAPAARALGVLPVLPPAASSRACEGRKAYDTMTGATAALRDARASRPRHQPPPGTVNLVTRRAWRCLECGLWHV